MVGWVCCVYVTGNIHVDIGGNVCVVGIYDDCDFGFVHPMPNEKDLNYFYENIYRSDGRPPYLVSENYEDQKKHYLEEKNLSYLRQVL